MRRFTVLAIVLGIVISSFGQIEQREFNRKKIDHFNHDNKFELDADLKNRNRLEDRIHKNRDKKSKAIISSRSTVANSLLYFTLLSLGVLMELTAH